jgi:hypothetical protein
MFAHASRIADTDDSASLDPLLGAAFSEIPPVEPVEA